MSLPRQESKNEKVLEISSQFGNPFLDLASVPLIALRSDGHSSNPLFRVSDYLLMTSIGQPSQEEERKPNQTNGYLLFLLKSLIPPSTLRRSLPQVC